MKHKIKKSNSIKVKLKLKYFIKLELIYIQCLKYNKSSSKYIKCIIDVIKNFSNYLILDILKMNNIDIKTKYILIKRKIQNGENINNVIDDDYTPLTYISKFCHKYKLYPILELLFQNNIIIDLEDKNERFTPLFYAVKYSNYTSNLSVIKYLIKKGANINYISDYTSSALDLSVIYSNDTSSLETKKFLIEKGANINSVDCDNCTPIMNCLLNTDSTSSNETFYELLKYNPDIKHRDDINWDCFKIILFQSYDYFKKQKLLEIYRRGALINHLHENNNNCFMILIGDDHMKKSIYNIDNVNLIFEFDFNINHQNDYGKTILMIYLENYSFYQNINIIKKFLIKYNIDLTLKDNQNNDYDYYFNTFLNSNEEHIILEFIKNKDNLNPSKKRKIN